MESGHFRPNYVVTMAATLFFSRKFLNDIKSFKFPLNRSCSHLFSNRQLNDYELVSRQAIKIT